MVGTIVVSMIHRYLIEIVFVISEAKLPKSPKRSFTSDKHPPASRKSVNRPESVHSSSEPTATMTLVYKPKSTKQALPSKIDILSL